MLCEKDIVLILDTNLFIDILSLSDGNISSRVQWWLGEILREIDCEFNGRTILLMVTTEILQDYKTGFNKSGIVRGQFPALKIWIEKNTGSKIPITSGNDKMFLILHKMGASLLVRDNNHRLSDKFDTKFLTLINTVFQSTRLKDRMILFASKDHTVINGLEERFGNGVDSSEQRFYMATDVDNLKNTILCKSQ